MPWDTTTRLANQSASSLSENDAHYPNLPRLSAAFFFSYFVLHTYYMITTPCATVQRKMLGPAVNGTTNVLKAASAADARRVVVVSSMVAVEIDPKDWPKDKIKDEGCWSDPEACRNNQVSIRR